MDYRPKSGKVEMHLTYGCNLACRNCNRMSFLREPHTPDMTLDDVKEFYRQAEELNFYPAILLIGGEPTFHPDFYEICRISREFADRGVKKKLGFPGREGLVQLWSNQFTEESREKCNYVRQTYNISVCGETVKSTSLVLSIDDIYVSPEDFGLPVRKPCWQHSSEICGLSVDGGGYSLCSIGGAIDGILGIGFRTKVLTDLFDQEKVGEITYKMCQHCGNDISKFGTEGASAEEWKSKVKGCNKWRGMYVSPIWEKAFKGIK